MVNVHFYGDNTTALLSKRNLIPFDTSMRIKSKRQLLKKAIEDAQKDYNKVPLEEIILNKAEIQTEENTSDKKDSDSNDLKSLRTEFEQLEKEHLTTTGFIMYVSTFLLYFGCIRLKSNSLILFYIEI